MPPIFYDVMNRLYRGRRLSQFKGRVEISFPECFSVFQNVFRFFDLQQLLKRINAFPLQLFFYVFA